jgi:hypothetical protein
VVAKEEDVQELPLWILLLLGTCFHLDQGPKDEKHAHGDDDVALGRNKNRIS